MIFDTGADEDGVMHEINMTPLVDIMLVLLIIFMITVPVIQHSVKLDLPHAASRPNDARPPHINLAIQSDGTLRWNGIPIANPDLPARIAAAAAQKPQPELHLYADHRIEYGRVAQVMAAAQSGGLTRIGFVTEPERAP